MIFSMRPFHGVLDTQFATIGHWQTTQQKVPHHIVTHSRRLLYRFSIHSHPYADRLLIELINKDILGLENLDTVDPELKEEFFEERYKPKIALSPSSTADLGTDPAAVLASAVDQNGKLIRSLLPLKNLDFDYAEGAYSVYNWEVFYHVPYLVATQLSKNGRHAEAQRWFHYLLDLTDNSNGEAPQRFWKVKPFQIDEIDNVEEILFNLSTGDNTDLQDRTIAAIANWRKNPFRPHLVARTRVTAYMHAVFMANQDNLIAWGDSLFRQDTREAINEATQLYVLAANHLGPHPQVVPRLGTLRKQSYADLRQNLDEFGNAVRDLEADIPFDLHGPGRPVNGSPSDAPMESLGRSLYFCVPRNDKFLGYWDIVADRLFKIRNSLNLAGVFRQLPLFAPPIDPAMLARAVAAGVDVASIIAGTGAPLAPVRFQVLLQKALEITQEVKSLGSQILAALEKKDNEALSVLRAKHETNLLSLAETVRYAQWTESTKNKEGIVQNISNAFQRYRYYDRLLGTDDSQIKLPEYAVLDGNALDKNAVSAKEPFSTSEPEMQAGDVTVEIGSSFRDGGHKINPSEAHELDFMEVAQILQDAGTVLEGIGAPFYLVPDFAAHATPLGVGARMEIGGTKFGHMFQVLAAISRGVGGRVQHEANMAGKMASYDRREQEWAYQRKAAAGELTQLYKQYRAAELREFIAKREYENHQKQIEQAKDVEDFLSNEKRKTTTEGFHLWIKGEAKGLHTRHFQFAYDVAKMTERGFQHEIGDPSASFIGVGYLGGREGLFAGEKLHLDIKRMDMAYSELYAREFEITKHVNLRDWFPVELLALRNTGKCNITIPEALFDLDCPGHYFRRIKSVAVSIPCVAGPYTSVNCSLTLSQSYVRTKPVTLDNQWYPNTPDPDTERFRTYPVAKDAIVTSSGQSDSGMFDTNLRDERYLPFEGAGVISKWNLELLGNPRQFDYDTISDLVLTLRYTARAGAPAETVSTAAIEWLKVNSVRAFSMRHEFPSEWKRFKASQVSPGQTASLNFELTEMHFPYRMQTMLSHAKRFQFVGQTAVSQIAAELFQGNSSIGKTNLGNGLGEILPVAQGGAAASFVPLGSFELRFDTSAFDDLWIVIDWNQSQGVENGV